MQIIKSSNLNISHLFVGRRETDELRFKKLSGSDQFALVLATWGVGFVRMVPATIGSALGVLIYLLTGMMVANVHFSTINRGWELPGFGAFHLVAMILAIAIVSTAGVWASSRSAKVLGEDDPRPIIIDEIAGQLLTFLLVPFPANAWVVIGGFVLFRIFDVLKPYPAVRVESLKSGIGIMADDLVAGAYAALVLGLLTMLVTRL